MDFKERFKGRTSNITKEGVISNLAAPSSAYVMKSTSNALLGLPSSSPNEKPSQSANLTHQKLGTGTGFAQEYRTPLPLQVTSNNQIKQPQHNQTNMQLSYSTRLPVENIAHTPTKNPYQMANPYPNLNNGDAGSYTFNQDPAAMGSMNHWNGQPNTFNPNSFYNQHSQYKGDIVSMSAQKGHSNVTPTKNQRENLATLNGFTPTNAGAKQNFEAQKPKRHAAYDSLQNFENQAGPQFIPNNRYLSYNQGLPGNYTGNFNYRPPIFANTYNAPPRESHSNPPPFTQYEAFPQHPATQGKPLPYQSVNGFGDSMADKSAQKVNRTAYKPYSLRDYKDVKSRAAVQLGGLGPNTNTSEWQKEKEKRNKMAEFSQNVKMFNSRRLIGGTDTGFKPKDEKERSRRDVALEFARNIPKPVRVKRFAEEEEIEELVGYQNHSPEGRIYRGPAADSHEFDELAAFERQHNQYRMHIENMK